MDMAPGLASEHLGKGRICNAFSMCEFGDAGASGPVCSDYGDTSFGQFGMGDSLASRRPAAFGCLRHVLCMGSEMKMSRVAARRVVAGMEDVQSVRDVAVGQYPDGDVATNRPPFPDSYVAVAPGIAISGPGPAFFRLATIDLRPHALSEGYPGATPADVSTQRGAVFTAASSDFRRLNDKGSATNQALPADRIPAHREAPLLGVTAGVVISNALPFARQFYHGEGIS